MNNIIQTYLSYLDHQGKPLDKGIKEINKALGSDYDKNYFSHLKSGKHKNVSMKLLCYLQDECRDFVAKKSGYRNTEKFKKAVKGLMPRSGK